jgi:hypothetical protein
MKNSGLEILLSSDDDYEQLTAEVFYRVKFVALFNQDNGVHNLQIEFPCAQVEEDILDSTSKCITFKPQPLVNVPA